MNKYLVTVHKREVLEITVEAENEEQVKELLAKHEFANEPQRRIAAVHDVFEIDKIVKDPNDMQDVGIG